MTQKENAQPAKAELSAVQTDGPHSICHGSNTANPAPYGGQAMFTFSTRQQRVIDALASTRGSLSRENIDRISGASNGPAVIAELRRKLGHNAIAMHLETVTDRDGKTARPGRYQLTSAGRARLAGKE